MTAIPRTKLILPWWQIGLLLGACGAAVFLLVPDDPQLVEDLLRDGKIKEARRQFEKMSAADTAQTNARYRLLELRLVRCELAPGDVAGLRAFWTRAVAAWRDADFADSLFLDLRTVVGRLADPTAAWRVVAPLLPRAPAKQRARLLEDFTHAALAAGQAGTAAEAFALGHPAADRRPAETLELARLWTLAGQTENALQALGDEQAPELAERRIELLRALNRNRDALALLRTRFSAVPDEFNTFSDVEAFTTVALQAGLPADAVPVYQRFVAANPSDLIALRNLRDLLVTAGQAAAAIEPARRAITLGERNQDDLRRLAQILEWSGSPSPAFEIWLELGLTGELPAIDRLIELNPGLYRDDDLLRALATVVPVSGRPDYTLRLARLEVVLGRYDRAVAHFQEYLANAATATDVMLELARLFVEINRFAEAETWLRQVAGRRPTDAAIQREIADVLVLEGRHSEALAIYARLAEQSPTAEFIEPYTRLAESLGRYGDLVRGLRTRIEHAPKPTARDYLMLAYGYEAGDDAPQRRRTLEEGLQRLPESDELRLQLASALAAEKNFVRSQRTLAPHTRLHEEPAATALFLELMRLNNDTTSERLFLATPLTPSVAGDESVRERLARTHEALRDYPTAERLRRELLEERPGDPERIADLTRVLLLQGRTAEARALLTPLLQAPSPAILRIAAEIAQASGGHLTAEKYQLAYLAAQRTAPALDWSALGDIRLSRGDRTGAKRAYAEALRRMQAQLPAKEGGP